MMYFIFQSFYSIKRIGQKLSEYKSINLWKIIHSIAEDEETSKLGVAKQTQV